MKPGIHPEYVDCTVKCSCGNTFTTRSTKPELKIDICNACHPFYTGTQKLIDTGGRVQRFADRFGSATEAVAKREAERKAAQAAKKAEAERAAQYAKKAAEAEAAKPTEEEAVEQAPEVEPTEAEAQAAVAEAVAEDANLDAVSEEAAAE